MIVLKVNHFIWSVTDQLNCKCKKGKFALSRKACYCSQTFQTMANISRNHDMNDRASEMSDLFWRYVTMSSWSNSPSLTLGTRVRAVSLTRAGRTTRSAWLRMTWSDIGPDERPQSGPRREYQDWQVSRRRIWSAWYRTRSFWHREGKAGFKLKAIGDRKEKCEMFR